MVVKYAAVQILSYPECRCFAAAAGLIVTGTDNLFSSLMAGYHISKVGVTIKDGHISSPTRDIFGSHDNRQNRSIPGRI